MRPVIPMPALPATFARLAALAMTFSVLAAAIGGGVAGAQPRYGGAHPPGAGGPAPGRGYAPRPYPRSPPPPEREGPPGPYRGYGPGYAPVAPPPAIRGGPPIAGWRAAPHPPPGPRLGRLASLGWVIERLQRRSPGRQLDAEINYMDGRPVYRVIWLTVRGRRIDYIVDATTGAILAGP
jgi:hypothetical protein